MEQEFIELAIKTPIFHGDKRNPPALIGTADGWLNPEMVCGITSGIHQVATVVDVRDKRPATQKTKPGGIFTVLHMESGDRVLVMGTPRELRQQIMLSLSQEFDVPDTDEEEETPQDSPDNNEPQDTNEPPEEPNEPSQGEEEGGE